MSDLTNLGYLKTEVEFEPLDACPWCQSTDLAHLATRGDGLEVRRCNSCHLGFLGSLPNDISIFYDDAYFTRSPVAEAQSAQSGYDDYDRSYSPSSFRWLASLIAATFPNHTSLFDFGAATGTFLEMAQAVGFDVDGSELTEAGALEAQRKGLNVRSGPFDPTHWEGASFQVVTALEVLEHVTDLAETLDGLKRLLTDDGVLVFLVPNISDAIVDEFGSGGIDFHKSYEHTLYFNAASLNRVFDETFGPGSLTLFTPTIAESDQLVSYAVGIVRMMPSQDTPEQRLFDIVDGQLPPSAALSVAEATATSLTAAKFYRLELADELIEQAVKMGASTEDLATVNAQLLRNKGEILNAIELLEGTVVADAHHGDPIAAPLLVETLRDLTSYLGIREPGLAVGLRRVLERLDSSKILERAIDQVEAREGELVKRAAHAETRATDAESRAIKAEERTIRAEERQRAAEHNRELTAGVAQRLSTDIHDANDQAAVAKARAEAASQEADDFRTTLNDIYASRTWKLASLPWKLKGRLSGGVAPVAYVEADDFDVAPATAPPSQSSFPVTISVIMPVYNKGRTLRDSIESLLNQTFQDFEVIVWDDGSTDELTQQALADVEPLPQITVVQATNQGVIGARNSAMRLARGEYYVCLDPDDRLRPTYLEKAVLYLESHPEISIVYPWQQSVGDVEETWMTADLDPTQIATSNHLPVCAVFREGLFAATGGFSAEMSDGFEDWEFWTHAAELGYRGRVIPERLFEYSYSHDPNESRDAEARGRIDEIGGRISSLHPTLETMRERPFDGMPSPSSLEIKPPTIPMGTGRPVILMLPWMTVGGADRVVKALANHWTEQGRTVIGITTLGVGPDMEDRIDDLLEITPYTYQLPNILPVHLWHGFVDRLLDTLDDATVLNIGSSWFYDQTRRLKSDHPRLRIVDQQFNDEGHLDSNQAAQDVIDLTVTAYKGLVERFLEDGRPKASVQEIYVGIDAVVVDTEAASATREQIGLPTGKRYAAFVGRLSEEKRPEWLLPLADALEPIDVHLVVVGTGPLGKKIGNDLNAHQGITWIKHADDIAAVFAGAALTVMPSTIEGIPLTAMESLAAGTPVVATRRWWSA